MILRRSRKYIYIYFIAFYDFNPNNKTEYFEGIPLEPSERGRFDKILIINMTEITK